MDTTYLSEVLKLKQWLPTDRMASCLSVNRAALFEMTFLMLVDMLQYFGSAVLLKDTQSCCFSTCL